MQVGRIIGAALLAWEVNLVAACSGDNCANHVTGQWAGIGVPIESRISMCNSFLRVTIVPNTTTITSTIFKYTTTNVRGVVVRDEPTNSSGSKLSSFRANATETVPYSGYDQTVVPSMVPTFATSQCPEPGRFSSACSCWASVTASTTTMSAPTVTVTATRVDDVGCGPAATAVAPGNGSYFPCSRQWGTCSCLKSGNQAVCVRVGPYLGDGRNMTGPCGDFDECDSDGNCRNGYLCVFDASCECGRRRCYRAAPKGCDYQGLPPDEVNLKTQLGL
ncbi:unnamed protein product [Clonostachys solani]|uniref:Uncharacterized protein n=1 Tax=Clonostachys solani TaxID=160281 RepID=A0A9N9VV55_9HYPO|nr:unnamed protein product [Clonostachys solani]